MGEGRGSSRLAEMNRLRKRAHARLVKSRSEVYAKFLELEEAAYAPRSRAPRAPGLPPGRQTGVTREP